MHRDEQSSAQAAVGPLGGRHDLPLRLSALSQVGYGDAVWTSMAHRIGRLVAATSIQFRQNVARVGIYRIT